MNDLLVTLTHLLPPQASRLTHVVQVWLNAFQDIDDFCQGRGGDQVKNADWCKGRWGGSWDWPRAATPRTMKGLSGPPTPWWFLMDSMDRYYRCDISTLSIVTPIGPLVTPWWVRSKPTGETSRGPVGPLAKATLGELWPTSANERRLDHSPSIIQAAHLGE